MEKCPYNCVSYIQRKHMDQHVKTCPKRSSMILNGIQSDIDLATLGERLSLIDENLSSMRKALNEEIQMRHEIIGELGGLKRQNQVSFDDIKLWFLQANLKFTKMTKTYSNLLFYYCRFQTIGP